MLNETIVDGVGNGNFKRSAERGQEMIDKHISRLDILAEKALAKSLESMDSMDIGEATAAKKLTEANAGNDLAKVAAGLSALKQMFESAKP